MILPGSECPVQNSTDEIANATVECFLDAVPESVPGIAFLSGGQSSELASERLNAMHVLFHSRLPWVLSFSFSRAFQEPALRLWAGDEPNVSNAQDDLLHRAKCNSAAVRGVYNNLVEQEGKIS